MADLTLFNLGMRDSFLRAMQVVADPAPYEGFTQIIDSKQRLENYPWMTPAPRLSRFLGKRRAGMISTVTYSVENKEFDATVDIRTRDAQDDLMEGWKIRMQSMAEEAKHPFRSKLVLSHLANGGTATCFDGSAFFSTSHTIGDAPATAPSSVFGGSGNALTFSAASADSRVETFIVLVKNGSYGLKPLLYQNRKAPELMTNFGTSDMSFSKVLRYWVDLEAAAAFGYWWDACRCVITNTPTFAELQTCIDGVFKQMYEFKLPKNNPQEPDEFVHEQRLFDAKNITIVCSTGLTRLFQHLLGEERIGINSQTGFTNNIYYRAAELCPTAMLNSGAVLLS